MALTSIVTLEEKVVTRDSFGSDVERWDTVDDLWASIRQTGATEQYLTEADRVQAIRNAIVRIRWRSDISEAEHRLVYDHHAWNILGIDAIGRREFMDLTVRTEIGGVLFLPAPFNVKAGLSDDAIPTAAEFTIDHTAAYVAFPAFTDKHILLWRDALEPDLETVVFK